MERGGSGENVGDRASLHPSRGGRAGCGRPLGLREGAQTHFSKLKRGKRMLFLMKMVKFSASIMMGLWAGTGGRGSGNEGHLHPRGHPSCWTSPECM